MYPTYCVFSTFTNIGCNSRKMGWFVCWPKKIDTISALATIFSFAVF